jgi:hypothetical protein
LIILSLPAVVVAAQAVVVVPAALLPAVAASYLERIPSRSVLVVRRLQPVVTVFSISSPLLVAATVVIGIPIQIH